MVKSSWDGNLLILEWNIEAKLDSKAVYAKWPNPEGFDDSDFF